MFSNKKLLVGCLTILVTLGLFHAFKLSSHASILLQENEENELHGNIPSSYQFDQDRNTKATQNPTPHLTNNPTPDPTKSPTINQTSELMMSSNVAIAAQTINFPRQSLEKGDKNGWIFYNGIPKSGTSSLRQSVIDTGRFQIKDITFWGCKSSVADNWREVYEEDLLSKNVQFQNQSLSVFATGHACWVDFSRFEEQPISIQTVRNPLSRWRSAFNYGISGKRGKEKILRSRKAIAALMGLDDPYSPEMTFENCVENDRCFSGHVLVTAMGERTAFTPCEACVNRFIPNINAEPFTNIFGITPRRNELLATIRLMLTQYDALIPMDDMKGGLKLIQHIWPTIFTNISSMESHARADGGEDRGTSIVQFAAERGGFLLTYQVACAKFCLEMDRLMFESDFCKDFIDSSGVADGQTSAVVSPTANNMYLLWTSPMKGGLHNQLMILTQLGELASELNRTLIVPQLLHGFPKRSNYLETNVEFDDIYDVAYLHQNGFPSNLISLNMVPPGLFLGNIETVDLDKNLKPPTTNAMNIKVQKLLEDSEKQLLVVKRDNTQNFSKMKIWRIYSSFRLSERLSLALEDCLRLILGIPAETPLAGQGREDPLGSLIFLHARVERDWWMYAEKQLFPNAYYVAISKIKKKMQESTNAILNITAAAASPTLIVSYGVGELVRGDTPDVMKNGWPKEFRVITSDDLELVLKKYTYLEKSAILSQIASRSKVFIGNSKSSFSEIIAKARRERAFWYNTEKTGFTDTLTKKKNLKN